VFVASDRVLKNPRDIGELGIADTAVPTSKVLINMSGVKTGYVVAR
jgi:hypothetical protein